MQAYWAFSLPHWPRLAEIPFKPPSNYYCGTKFCGQETCKISQGSRNMNIRVLVLLYIQNRFKNQYIFITKLFKVNFYGQNRAKMFKLRVEGSRVKFDYPKKLRNQVKFIFTLIVIVIPTMLQWLFFYLYFISSSYLSEE